MKNVAGGAPNVNLKAVLDMSGWVFMALAGCGALFAYAATWATVRFLGRSAPIPSRLPSVSVLKPLHGDEPGLYENLVSFCAQDYPGSVQLILSLQDPADPALKVAERLKNQFPDRDILVVCDPTLHGSNRKIGNLINSAGQAKGAVIVISDSDVRLAPDGLARIVAALDEPQVGLIYALYRGRPAAGFWSKMAALDIDTRFAANVVAGQALGAHPCLGPTMALRADLLAQIGGFDYLADFLADDFELGRAVRAAGYRIACPPMLIEHAFPEDSAREMLSHELRWSRTIRILQPSGYTGSVITHFLPLALIGAALTSFSALSLALLGGFLVARLIQAAIMLRAMGAESSLLLLTPLRDLLSFGVFIAANFGDRVEWRGNFMRVGRDGAMAAT